MVPNPNATRDQKNINSGSTFVIRVRRLTIKGIKNIKNDKPYKESESKRVFISLPNFFVKLFFFNGL